MYVTFKTFVSLFFLFLVLSVTAQKKIFKKTIKINGRIQYDYEFLKRDKSDNWFNGNEFRRLHLSASGKIATHIKYKIETDFSHGIIGFRDVYIKYVDKKWGNFAIGSMAEPTGLDMATSSKYSPFFERAMLTSLQNFRWGSGLHYENFGLFNSKLSLQMAYTNNGSTLEGFKDKNLEKPQNFSARMTSTPINNSEKHILVHLGLNYAYRPYKDLKFRAENHMGDTYHYVIPNASHRREWGYEFASTFKSISIQAEYKTQSFINAPRINYLANGYYVMGSFFVTGEYRPYKKASFGSLKPKNSIDNGGLGALELVARYSNLTVSQAIVDVNPTIAGQVNNISLGFNWYLTSHIRIMYNYIYANDKNLILGDLSGHLCRVAIDF